MPKTVGHLGLDKSLLIGKKFKFYAYNSEKYGGLVKLHIGHSKDFMHKCASLYGYKESDIVEGELEIIELLRGSVYEDTKLNDLDCGNKLFLGMYKCFNYQVLAKEFKEIPETVDFICDSKISMNLCFSHVDYRLEEDNGHSIGVVIKVSSYARC